jgi:hypothetical protein
MTKLTIRYVVIQIVYLKWLANTSLHTKLEEDAQKDKMTLKIIIHNFVYGAYTSMCTKLQHGEIHLSSLDTLYITTKHRSTTPLSYAHDTRKPTRLFMMRSVMMSTCGKIEMSMSYISSKSRLNKITCFTPS